MAEDPSLYFQKETVKGSEGAEIQRHSGNTAKTIKSAIQKQCQPAFTPTQVMFHCVTEMIILNPGDKSI